MSTRPPIAVLVNKTASASPRGDQLRERGESKHRNGKRTAGKKRFEAQSKAWQAVLRREANKKNGRYRD